MGDGKGRRRRPTHTQKLRLEELEEKLFGGATASLSEFGKEEEQNAGRLPSVLGQGVTNDSEEPLIIWEDRRNGGVQLSESEDSSEEDSGELERETESPEKEDAVDSEEGAGVGVLRKSVGKDADDEEDSGSDGEPGKDPSAAGESDGELEERRDSGRLAGPSGSKRKPVWDDSDEESLQVDIAAVNRLRKLRTTEADAVISGREYSKRLKKQHAKMNPRTSWAALDKSRKSKADVSEDELEDEQKLERIRQGAASLLQDGAVLPAGHLEATRVKDANQAEPSNAAVQSVAFHPSGQLLLTAGLDKRLTFFQVDGVKNAKVQSIFLSDLPIHKAAFASEGTQVIASGRRKYFYVLDLESAKVERVSYLAGRLEKSLENFAVSPDRERPLIAFLGARGYLPLVSCQSRQLVAQLKMPASVRSAAFSDDGTYLMASGGDGVVYTWDMRTRQCMSRFVDEGALRGISMASSPGQRFLATGSDAGFVNIYTQKSIYEAGSGRADEPKRPSILAPTKSFKNLTTAIDNLAFSPDGQILAMSSKMKKDGLRLIHTGTMSVFSNWPTSRTPLHYVNSTAFSPGGGFFVVGNAKGKVLMYRLHHYAQI